MAEIIKEPEGPAFTVDVLCTGEGNDLMGCGATIRFEYDDLYYYKGQVHPIIKYPAVGGFCPRCKTPTDIPHSQWPKAFHNLSGYSDKKAELGITDK